MDARTKKAKSVSSSPRRFFTRHTKRHKTRLGCRLNAGGAGPRSVAEVKDPDEVGPNQEHKTLGYLGLSSNSPKAKHRPLGRSLSGRHKMPTTPQIQYWHLAIFNPFQELDRFLQYLRYNASGVKSLI
jgi:hypothetical protein